MHEISWVLALLAATGVAVALMAALARWCDEPTRRVRRGLRLILGGHAPVVLIAPGSGRGVGFDFISNQVAVAWDRGGWGLLYGLDTLRGAEAIVDGQVVSFAYRGQGARRRLDPAPVAERRVALRLHFDDPAYPHFLLDLWRSSDADRRDALSPDEALAEAARWLVRVEALLNRPRHSWWETPPAAAPWPPAAAKPERQVPTALYRANRFDNSHRDENAA
jgi:hypothetical protein